MIIESSIVRVPDSLYVPSLVQNGIIWEVLETVQSREEYIAESEAEEEGEEDPSG
jgi:hypothetical protein